MRVVVLGASGLIGHRLVAKLAERGHEVTAVLRKPADAVAGLSHFNDSTVVGDIDVVNSNHVFGLLDGQRAQVVLNCAGITKRKDEINDLERAIRVNAMFPHQLADWARTKGARVIHFSTDCVFDGTVGDYTEESTTTPLDTYGRTKALGEIRYDHTLTIRSSFIGRELFDGSELLEWLLSQDGQKIKGFTEAYYSGVSTLVMARTVGTIIEEHPDLGGLVQLASPEAISKYDLLAAARDAYDLDIEIQPDSSFVTKPTLDGSTLSAALKLDVPGWPIMLKELAEQSYQTPSKWSEVR